MIHRGFRSGLTALLGVICSGALAATTAPSARPIANAIAVDEKQLVAEFEILLSEVVSYNKSAGLAAALVQDDRVLLQRGLGMADARAHLPVTDETVFRVASLSKAFATTLAALLVQEQLLSWETRVADVLPTFTLNDVAGAQQLTVRDILSHRVGLPHNTYDWQLEQDQPYQILVEKLKDVRPICAVGDCYSYQNISFSMIGDLTFAVTGDFFYHQVEKRLFHPLGMHNATYGRDALEASASWARPHMRSGRSWVPIRAKENYYRIPPAAGVNASVKDMAQWLLAQLGGRPDILGPEILREIHTPLVATAAELRSTQWRRQRLSAASYALGWRVYDYAGETLVFHAGAVQGYRAMIGMLPKRRFGVVLLWNCESATPAGLLPTVLDRYLGLPRVDWVGLDKVRRRPLVAGATR